MTHGAKCESFVFKIVLEENDSSQHKLEKICHFLVTHKSFIKFIYINEVDIYEYIQWWFLLHLKCSISLKRIYASGRKIERVFCILKVEVVAELSPLRLAWKTNALIPSPQNTH